MALPGYAATMRWVPTIDYTNCGVPASWAATLPMERWDHFSTLVGGAARADSGVQEVFRIRQDNGLILRIRHSEEEWVTLQGVLEVIQGEAQSFDLTMDTLVGASTQYTFQLEDSAAQITPRRSGSNIIMVTELRLLMDDGSVMDLPFDPRS